MEIVTLGRTNLKVSVAGLGTGGHSRIGLAKYGEDHAASIVKAAFDGGVNFFDSSKVYGTQAALGKGLNGIKRDAYVLSTKFPYKQGDKVLPVQAFWDALEESLRLLNSDYIDIYHLHAVEVEDLETVKERFLPELIKAKEQGKIRFTGVTEAFIPDPGHEMLALATEQNLFDVVMVGYNMLNQSADERVLPYTKKNNIGTLCMFAVRTALSNLAALSEAIALMLAKGQGDADMLKQYGELAFLTQEGAAASIMQAAYRFCRHADGLDVILTGTSSIEHLKDNLRAIEMPALPKETVERLRAMFKGVDCVSGE